MVTVFESDKLKAAQDAVTLFDKVVIALLVVTVLLLAATIAPGRSTVGASSSAWPSARWRRSPSPSPSSRPIKAQVLDLVGDPTTRRAAGKTIQTLVIRLDWIV